MTLRERLESPEVVEAVTKAIAKADGFCWEDVIGDAKIPYRVMAKAAITAMLAALNPKEMSNDDR